MDFKMKTLKGVRAGEGRQRSHLSDVSGWREREHMTCEVVGLLFQRHDSCLQQVSLPVTLRLAESCNNEKQRQRSPRPTQIHEVLYRVWIQIWYVDIMEVVILSGMDTSSVHQPLYTLLPWQTCSLRHHLGFFGKRPAICYASAKATRTHIHHCM